MAPMTERTLRHDGAAFTAESAVPGDKSMSHRALILAAMADGTSRVTGLGPGRDVAATAGALRSLGVLIEPGNVISGGVAAWIPALGPIDCSNSGTTMRLMTGALAGRPFASTLVGDASLSARPMRRLVRPLRALGAVVVTAEDGTPPVTTGGADALSGADVTIPMASAQVRSAFSLAALQAEGPSRLDSPAGFRDHTERWLESLGLGRRAGTTVFDIAPAEVPPAEYLVPGDPSSAAFLWAAAALVEGARVTTPGVALNPGRTGFLEVLAAMGAEVAAEPTGAIHGDPVGTVTVTGAGITGTRVDGELAVRALDELPLVAVVAGAGRGDTVVADAGELRAKESDRIASSVAMVRDLGGRAEAASDGYVVTGSGGYRGGVVEAGGDHRIAMAGAVAATRASGDVIIAGAGAAGVSWPGFYDVLEALWSSR